MFQTVLVSMFVVTTLLVVGSMSAGQEDWKEWTLANMDWDSVPESQFPVQAKTMFDRIINEPWQEKFLQAIGRFWQSWSLNQKIKVAQRMQQEGLIALSQTEPKNLIDLTNGPEITMGG